MTEHRGSGKSKEGGGKWECLAILQKETHHYKAELAGSKGCHSLFYRGEHGGRRSAGEMRRDEQGKLKRGGMVELF